MDRFRKTFSVRKKKDCDTNESSKPQLWIEDERKIKEGSCSFQVKYLGSIEVFESRGMQVCEEAIKALRKPKKKPQRAILYVSGDALRVSDEISKHLIVDQTIEKVSFCAPDRGHDKGFAYICRDGATRRWMCHAFLAVKESGERLSHAVGCAFAICLERKQKRERDAVQSTYASDDGSFVRMSSFRQTSLSERLLDPQSAIVVDHSAGANSQSGQGKADASKAIVPFDAASDRASTLPKLGSGAIPRPRANPSLIERQSSLRLFPKLQETSPFKHSFSMRSAELGAHASTSASSSSALQPRTNLILNGTSIPEETATDLEAGTADRHGNQTRTLPMTWAFSQPTPSPVPPAVAAAATSPTPFSFHSNEAPAATATTALPTSLTPTVAAFPVSFEETPSVAALGGPDSLLAGLDPFSAAPFNPATIQQHQVAAQLQQQQQQLLGAAARRGGEVTISPNPPSRASPAYKSPTTGSGDSTASPLPSVVASPFPVVAWPEAVPSTISPLPTSSVHNGEGTASASATNGGGGAPITTSASVPAFPFSSALDAASTPSLGTPTVSETGAKAGSDAFISIPTTAAAAAASPFNFPEAKALNAFATPPKRELDSQWPGSSNTSTSLTPWLPPIVNPNITDNPFDVAWAEKVTALARDQLAGLASSQSQTIFPASVAAPAAGVSTNPFLAFPSESG